MIFEMQFCSEKHYRPSDVRNIESNRFIFLSASIGDVKVEIQTDQSKVLWRVLLKMRDNALSKQNKMASSDTASF